MKKLTIITIVLVMLLSMSACGKQNTNDQNETTVISDNTEITTTIENESLTKWQMAGKGIGKILPEPELEYSLPQSGSFIAAEVKNVTYDFFEDYVNQCIRAGFEGSIGTAESPDYYFNGETTNGERVQVMFYEAENKVSISAFPAK